MSGKPPRPRLVFVNRYYWPDELATAQLLTDLAEALAGRGWSVQVITSRGHPAAAAPRETRAGVQITRVRATRWGGRIMAGKGLDYLTFSFAARRALRRELRPGDCAVAMTDPPTLATLAAATARRAEARLVHWVQDIHPEISLALTGSKLLPLLTKPWVRRRDAAWRFAQACVTVSRDMAGLIGGHGVSSERIKLIPNWAPGGALVPVPPAENALRREWGLAGKFVVAYSGNLGRVHALAPVLDAAALLCDERNLVFLFIGDGPQRQALETDARTQGLENVRFLPPQPRARLGECLSVGDLHLVTLRDGCEQCVFPSKIYGIAAVGRPVIFLGPPQCGLAQSIRDQGLGLTLRSDEPGGLATAVQALRADGSRRAGMAAAALRWAQSTGGLPAALAAWERLLGADGPEQLPLAVQEPVEP